MIVRTKNIVRILLGTAFLLMVPLVAMQMTDEVVWGPEDFVAAGILIGGTGLLYELAVSQVSLTAYRVAVGSTLGTALLLVWTNLAVGLIGSEGNPANLMYVGVLAVGVIGAVVVHLEPRGMARTLFATAIAQALVPMIAIAVWRSLGSDLTKVLGANAFFVSLWVGSALLFFRAGARLHTQPAG